LNCFSLLITFEDIKINSLYVVIKYLYYLRKELLFILFGKYNSDLCFCFHIEINKLFNSILHSGSFFRRKQNIILQKLHSFLHLLHFLHIILRKDQHRRFRYRQQTWIRYQINPIRRINLSSSTNSPIFNLTFNSIIKFI
jgi:hypothetical protein